MSRWPVRISQAGGGPTPPGDLQDRFAPKYVVGNWTYGDSAAAYNTGGFRYFKDIGDGAGIAAALAAAALTPGDIWIRPGVYNLNQPGSPSTPLIVPVGVRVQGSGGHVLNESPLIARGTIIVAKSGASGPEDQSVFKLDPLSQLENIGIYVPPYVDTGTKISKDYVVEIDGHGVTVRNVEIVTNIASKYNDSGLKNLLLIDAGNEKENAPLPISLENLVLINIAEKSEVDANNAIIKMLRGSVSARNIQVIGGATGIEVRNSVQVVEPYATKTCEFRGTDIFVYNSKFYGIRYLDNPDSETPYGRGCVKILRAKIGPIKSETNPQGGFGVFLNTGEGHTISDTSIDAYDGVFIGATSGSVISRDVLITGCEILADRNGVVISTVNTVEVNPTVERVSVTDCSISLQTYDDSQNRYAVLVDGAVDVTIASNTILIVGDPVPQ